VPAAAAAPLIGQAATAGPVDIRLEAIGGPFPVCENVRVDIVTSSNSGAAAQFDALDAVILWDPAVLELLGKDDTFAGADFFICGFLPDPDDVNDDLTDGDGIFTALAFPGAPVTVPPAPGTLIVTSLIFRVLAPAPATVVDLLDSIGVFGETRALLVGADVTGAIAGTGPFPVGSCDADIDADGDVGFPDLLILLSDWGPCSGCCPADLDFDENVGFPDLLILLSNWGPCP
jgi:hypothetical protein